MRHTPAPVLSSTPDNTPCYLANDDETIDAIVCPWDHDRGEDLWSQILSGDQEAATKAMQLAPNENRGRIVRVAYRENVPNPAFRELVLAAWRYDREWLQHAAGGPGARQSTLMRWFDRAELDMSELTELKLAS
jgi:hypothetical protein